MSEYNAGQIRVLEGLEAVRVRPGMYIGTTGPRGLHHLVWEIVDNAVDEALAGFCDHIDLYIDRDSVITVTDNGRGVPTEMHPTQNMPTPQVVYTKLHAGAKFGDGGYKVSGGLHGVGASVVNALSEWFEVEIYRDGKIHNMRFERGDPVTGLEVTGNTRKRGTRVRFKPDHQIFPSLTFNLKTLVQRVRELAFLNGGLSIRVVDRRGLKASASNRPDMDEFYGDGQSDDDVSSDIEDVDEPDAEATAEADGAESGTTDEGVDAPKKKPGRFDETFKYDGGLVDFVRYLNEGTTAFHAPVVFSDSVDGIEVDVAFQYNDAYAESINSFVNCINTVEGGQHETGFKTAHTRVMNEYAKKLGVWKKKESLSGGDLREGLMAVVNLRMGEAEFEGQTKTKLGNPEARSAVDHVVSTHLAAWLEENPADAKNILDKAAQANGARQAARKARKAARTATKGRMRTSLDGKLTRCSSRKSELNELFIVEGDSAGGSAKQGRDRVHQAILPLKGKPLNTERAPLAKVLGNKEILSIVQSVGAGIGSEFDLERSNYGRIVVLADADDDGAHIRCLLLTFFYRFMKPMVAAGMVYIAQPPLYKVDYKPRGKKVVSKYLWSDGELRKVLAKRTNATVQRFKGLGEMNPDQLWDTTMNPETRTLVRVTIDSAAAANHQVTTLMGAKADVRKKWIVENVQFGEDNDWAPTGPGAKAKAKAKAKAVESKQVLDDSTETAESTGATAT